MRILHLIHSFPPESHGGTETYVGTLAAAQRAAGDEARVLAGSDRDTPSRGSPPEVVQGVTVSRLPAPERGAGQLLGLNENATEALRMTLERFQADVVHLHHWHNLTSDAVRTCEESGVPAIVTLHDLFVSCPLFFRLPDDANLCAADLPRETCARCISRFLPKPMADLQRDLLQRESRFRDELTRADRVLVLSRSQRDFLAAVPALANLSLEVLPLPAPKVPAATDEEPTPRDPGRRHLVTWGGLIAGKGLHVLVEAVRRVSRPERFVLHHHGRLLDEAYAADLRRRAGPVRLEFHGPYRESELGRFRAYDLAVFPSLYLETHGFVLDEALALGLPVLVPDRGAPVERMGERGRAFAVGDPEALAAILEQVDRHPDLLEQWRAAPLPPVHGVDDHVARLRAIYAAATRRR